MIKVSLHDAQTQYEDIGLIDFKNLPFAGRWEYGHAPTSIWQHNWHLVFFFSFFFLVGVECKSARVGKGGMGSKYDPSALNEISK